MAIDAKEYFTHSEGDDALLHILSSWGLDNLYL